MSKSKPGPKIGQPHRHIRKRHPKYRKSVRQPAISIRRRMSGSTGFVYLQADSLYLSGQSKLVVTISSKNRETNKGPGIFLKRIVEGWTRAKNADGSIHEAVQEVLDDVVAQVEAMQLPERELYLSRCNTVGKDAGSFIDDVCSTCECWYCELVS